MVTVALMVNEHSVAREFVRFDGDLCGILIAFCRGEKKPSNLPAEHSISVSAFSLESKTDDPL